MSQEFSVRLYEIHQDGEIEPLFASSLGYFGGSCPNVGDTIAKLIGLEKEYRFYNVQRRIFVDTFDAEQGWAVLIRRVEPNPLMTKVKDEWIDETKFWLDIDEKEKRAKARAIDDSLRNLLMKRNKRRKNSPAPDENKD